MVKKLHRNKIFFFVVIAFCNFNIISEDKFRAEETDIDLAKEIISILQQEHYVDISFDEIQEDALQTFIESLDPNRLLFLESEVSYFSQQNNKDIDFTIYKAFEIFNLYSIRNKIRQEFKTNLLNEIDTPSFYEDRNLKLDRSENFWENNLNKVELLWADFLINDLIQLMVNGNTLDESKSKLAKRHKSQKNYFSQTKKSDVFNIFMNSVTSRFGPATNYFSPKMVEDFDIDMKLSLEGIGAILAPDGLYTSVREIVPGGPADKSNLLSPEDKIIGVGQGEKEIVDIIGWRLDDAVRLIRGPKSSKVKLELIPANAIDESETKIIEIERGLVKLEDQSAQKKTITINKEGKDYLIGVITLPAFYMDFEAYQRREYNFKSSSNDVKKLLIELKEEKIDGLILDLRNNGGGSLFEANSLAHLFLGAGQIVQVKNASGNIQGLGQRRGFQFYDKPLAVLVNKFSASASEILAGAIQDYERGIIIGTETFGKGTVQRMEPLSRGKLKFTESKFYRVTGNSVQINGVVPDILLPDIINSEEIGMKTLENPLIYDTISPAKFRSFKRVPFIDQDLIEATRKRVNASPVFQYIVGEKMWRTQQKEKNLVSLNLDKRKKLKKDLEEEFLKRQNELRGKLGLSIFKNYKSYLDSEKDADEDLIDPYEEILKEASNILADSIDSSFKPIVASVNK
tara:strand:- start:14612 stop:16666 length:2055 start_codon:yes stop_codon:yes gene_type:complete